MNIPDIKKSPCYDIENFLSRTNFSVRKNMKQAFDLFIETLNRRNTKVAYITSFKDNQGALIMYLLKNYNIEILEESLIYLKVDNSIDIFVKLLDITLARKHDKFVEDLKKYPKEEIKYFLDSLTGESI